MADHYQRNVPVLTREGQRMQTVAGRGRGFARYATFILWFAWTHRGGRKCGPDCRCDEM